ncbi:hypothetical protein DEMA109039_12910 [Deinococcus marmoris]
MTFATLPFRSQLSGMHPPAGTSLTARSLSNVGAFSVALPSVTVTGTTLNHTFFCGAYQ